MSARCRSGGSDTVRTRASVVLLLAHVVLFVLTIVGSSTTVRQTGHAHPRIESVHTAVLTAARPAVGEDLGRRPDPSPLAMPWTSGPIAVPAAPYDHSVARDADEHEPTARPRSPANARGPPRAA